MGLFPSKVRRLSGPETEWPGTFLGLELLGLGHGDLNLDSSVDVDRSDLTNNLRRRVQVDQSLVNTHFEVVIRVGSFTTRRLAGDNAQHLCGQADGARVLQGLLLRALDQITAHFLESCHFAAGQRDADAMHRGNITLVSGLLFREGHLNKTRSGCELQECF
eukprot:CAMPEP_0205819926 /NCGR_PEP_ID=MMETSP0206-20130828/2441_1 /ASSEMBLY_ACC=CAM_ASM_000279 /TAXON_ID=36767 /ORGANISM="Euplotes focardii, Strain TN1" /LENGTH=161 /DNA_ID=CAMNT_0053114051 /DNA_START=68 /DNA_END=551 /DNA_ORIENTATION=-